MRDGAGLLSDRVLVRGKRPQGHGAVVARGHKREVVLVPEKVLVGGGEHPVEWVDQLGVELAKGEFAHVVGKVECCVEFTWN